MQLFYSRVSYTEFLLAMSRESNQRLQDLKSQSYHHVIDVFHWPNTANLAIDETTLLIF